MVHLLRLSTLCWSLSLFPTDDESRSSKNAKYHFLSVLGKRRAFFPDTKKDQNGTEKESLLPSEGVHFEDDEHGPSEEEDEDHSMVSEAEIDKEWDEGGPSHCGYSEGVHDTLMTVGKSVHKVIGDPPSSIENGIMKQIGTWFQEMSYAVRDVFRGKDDVHDDISKAASTIKDDALASVFGSAPRENDDSFT